MKYERKKDKNFWLLARAYLHSYMPVTRNLSDKSVETYKQSLKSYLHFLEDAKSVSDEQVTFDSFNRRNVQEFIQWLTNKRYSAKTINLKLTAIRSFLKYCGQEDFELQGVYTDVCAVRKLKEEKHPVEYLQPAATAAILDAYGTEKAKHRRNRMLLILMYDTGARVQELSDLNVSSLHLNVQHAYVTLIGKGKKSRNVPILEKTVQHMLVFLRDFHPKGDEAPLFYSVLGGRKQRLSTDSISMILKTAADIARNHCAEVPARVHCHLMRKTKAMNLYRSGVPLPFIMQLLGHESMSTTSGFYAFATLEMMADAMNKATDNVFNDEKLWKSESIRKALYSLD